MDVDIHCISSLYTQYTYNIFIYTGWLAVWNMNFMTFHILGIISPFDFHMFQRGWNHQPVYIIYIYYIYTYTYNICIYIYIDMFTTYRDRNKQTSLGGHQFAAGVWSFWTRWSFIQPNVQLKLSKYFTMWLIMTNIAMAIMENGPFIDGLPIKDNDFP